MKKIVALSMVFSILLLCCACGSEPVKEEDTIIRYEAGAADYTQEGAKLTMELNFAQPVPAESEIALMYGNETLLQFRLGEAISQLQISSKELRENIGYTLLVDGVMQKHGQQEENKPGDIPSPTEPTVPVEVKTQESESTESETEGGFNFNEPPAGLEIGQPIGSLSGEEIDVTSGGELPSEGFQPGKEDSTLETEIVNPLTNRDKTKFQLDGDYTSFYEVRDVS